MIWLWIALAELGAGFALSRIRQKTIARYSAWLMTATAVALGYADVQHQPSWLIMLVLILLLLLGMKTVAVVYRYPERGRLSFARWCIFALGWVGMDPLPFEQPGRRRDLRYPLIIKSLFSIAVGGMLLGGLAFLVQSPGKPDDYVLCLLSFPAFILILHSGLLSLLSALYRLAGVDLPPLMLAPLQSQSLGEFWGQRWNTAFIQMTRITLFVPLARKMNKKAAFVLAFLLSGILHEIAISLPVKKGFGLPVTYFLLQAVLILAEREFIKKMNVPVRRLWTFVCLALPFPLLFHRPFMDGCILPLLQWIHAACW